MHMQEVVQEVLVQQAHVKSSVFAVYPKEHWNRKKLKVVLQDVARSYESYHNHKKAQQVHLLVKLSRSVFVKMLRACSYCFP